MKAAARRELLAALLPGLLLAGWIALAGALAALALTPAQRAGFAAALLADGGALLFLAWLLAAAALGWFVHRCYRRLCAAPARVLERAQALVAGADPRELADAAAADLHGDALAGLAQLIDALRAAHRQLQSRMTEEVAAASRKVGEERNRLAALMSELTQAVVVCNQDGTVLLYNGRARRAFRALSQAPELAGGAELVGLGRSIYAVLDRPLVEHALERVAARLAQGQADPSAQFVTGAPGAQLLRVQLAPVRAAPPCDDGNAAADARQAALAGFVLMIDNVTREIEQQSRRDELLLDLTEGSRAALANVRAATEMLALGDLDPALRERFETVVREEVAALSQRVQTAAERALQLVKTRWPLEDMRGRDLIEVAVQRLGAQLQRPVTLLGVDDELWLRLDSYSLLLALEYLAMRVRDELGQRFVQLRLTRASRSRARLDLVWSGQAVSTETVMGWQMEPIQLGRERSPLSVRDVLERHDAECWFERDRPRQHAMLCFLLPLAEARDEPDEAPPLRPDAARPEYFDFDLFTSPGGDARELADRPLRELSFTVFDTETTGLDPAQGDEIVQIGAVRIVRGRLLVQESFEQLVDPQRPISAASVAVHGIGDEMVAGQPTIGAVLPAFHAFAQGSVLVAHNAAFDLRFLQMKEAATGVCFTQPVLDTLLLSAVAQPQQPSHTLEAIAERLGVPVDGRHSALGDALVTAQVLLKLISLLQLRGINTLREALDASQQTWYARLQY